MKGLILKDILVARKTLRTYVILLILYIGMAFMGLFSLSVAATMLCVVIMVLPLSSFAFDDQAKWNRYAMCLPLGPKSIVMARYCYVLLAFAVSLIIGLALAAAGYVTDPDGESLIIALASICVSLAIAIFSIDITLPLSYKLGVERARAAMFIALIVPVILLFLVFKLGLLPDLSFLEGKSDLFYIGLLMCLPAVSLVGMFISYLISCRIVAGKEY